MPQHENQLVAPSVLEREDVREALEFLKEHASDLSESSMSFAVPAEFSNGRAQEFIKNRILKEEKSLRRRLGIKKSAKT